MNKIEFKDLPDTTTPFTAGLFNEMQDNVEEAINLTNTYSTDEIVIGTWLGKPLYRKVIISYGTAGDEVAIPHNITNFKQLINYSINAGENGMSYPTNNHKFDIWLISVDTQNINMLIGGAFLNWKVFIILDYIKTTD